MTGSTADLSYVLAAQILPSLVFALAGGVFADRIAPQKVIVAANLMIAVGEGGFGLLVLTGHPQLWQMIALETLTGAGMAVFYPASQALLPRLVPAGAAAGGQRAQPAGDERGADGRRRDGRACSWPRPGPAGRWPPAGSACWARCRCCWPSGRRARERTGQPSLLRDLREGWAEFASHTWLWATTVQFCVVLAAWYGAFDVLGPAVARRDLGGPAAWGADHGRGRDRPDHRRPDRAAFHPAPADPLRGAHRRGLRDLAAGAGGPVAAPGDLRGRGRRSASRWRS